MITKTDCIATGCVDYFPNALAAVGRHSRYGNEKHNPGEPMHWAFDKSTAHADAVLSHFTQRGQIDPETGEDYDIGALWRMLALVESRLVMAGATPGRAVQGIPTVAKLRAAVKEQEGGPDLYDPKTRQILAHPAQKLAVAAFTAEELQRTPISDRFASLRPSLRDEEREDA